MSDVYGMADVERETAERLRGHATKLDEQARELRAAAVRATEKAAECRETADRLDPPKPPEPYVPRYHAFRIGMRVRVLQAAEFSWGWSPKAGDVRPIVSDKDMRRLDFEGVEKFFAEVLVCEVCGGDHTAKCGYCGEHHPNESRHDGDPDTEHYHEGTPKERETVDLVAALRRSVEAATERRARRRAETEADRG